MTINAEFDPLGNTSPSGASVIMLPQCTSAPQTPASGKVIVYAKNDGLVYGKAPSGTETILSGIPTGSSSPDNYFSWTPPPTVSNWTWVNQGTATASDEGPSVVLTAQAASGDNCKILKRTAPAAPYTVTAVIIPQGVALSFMNFGILHRDSGGGKLTVLGFTNSGLQVLTYTSPTSTGTNQTGNFPGPTAFVACPWLYLKMQDDNTNRIYSWSTNGRVFTQLYSVARTTHHTPDEIGFMVSTNETQFPISLCLLSWLVA